MDPINADSVVDCRGLMCPMPIVAMAKGIKALEVGQILRIDADAEALRSDVPSWCKTTGHELLDSTNNEGTISYFVRKTA